MQDTLRNFLGIYEMVACHKIYKDDFVDHIKSLMSFIEEGNFEKVKKYSSIKATDYLLDMKSAIEELQVNKYDKKESAVRSTVEVLQGKLDRLNNYATECICRLASLKKD